MSINNYQDHRDDEEDKKENGFDNHDYFEDDAYQTLFEKVKNCPDEEETTQSVQAKRKCLSIMLIILVVFSIAVISFLLFYEMYYLNPPEEENKYTLVQEPVQDTWTYEALSNYNENASVPVKIDESDPADEYLKYKASMVKADNISNLKVKINPIEDFEQEQNHEDISYH